MGYMLPVLGCWDTELSQVLLIKSSHQIILVESVHTATSKSEVL